MFILLFISFYDIINKIIHIKGYQQHEKSNYKMDLAT